MKKALLIMMCVAAMMAAGTGLRAQEVTISLNPGWNWISYPYAVSMTIDEALANFQAMVGDQLKSKTQVAAWDDDEQQWSGSLTNLTPGQGYMYYSSRTEVTSFVFANPYSSFVTTAEPTDITATSAVVSSTVTIGEGNHVYARGVCWGTEPNPDIDGSHTSNGIGIGSFSDTLTELTSSTMYYVRAYMVTDYGLTYGEELSFTTESGIPAGTINGLFSVSENTQVYFSQGNLQYQASTNTWRFAENQWDYIGDGNSNISSTYNGWIDLFNWGTSGYNHGANCYQPWSTSVNSNDYYAYGISTYSLNDSTGMADWGYNAISNGGNQENQWYVLSYDEWNYVLFERETSSGIRFARAKVNGFNGVIILSDNWDASNYSLNNTNVGSASYSQNSITLEDWINFFQETAVFLPCAGNRSGTYIYNNSNGDYWSSTRKMDNDFAYDISIQNGYLGHSDNNGIFAQSVRLVRPSQANTSYIIEATPNPTEVGSVMGFGEFLYGAVCTLTATSNEGYTFTNWTENGEVVSTNTIYSFRVTGNRNLVANFAYNSGSDHEYVDLGLPSGTLWATCNVGANSPEDYGDYFAWGETQSKDYYDWSTYQYCDGSNLTKYTGSDGLTTLLPEDDAATANWGGGWRMPTKEEWQELYQNTTHTWTTQNGVNGRLFTASNGNSLFLPAAGYRNYSSLFNAGSFGGYWSSSLCADNPNRAWNLYFGSGYYGMDIDYGRCHGQSVRPVRSSGQNTAPTGAINGKFTINADGDQVYFSQGNLQYQASTNTWKFANNQYDYIGDANNNISSTYSGWIDIFGWGTSGYHDSNDPYNVNYQPWSTSTSQVNSSYNYYGYGPSTNMTDPNLTGTSANYDWGVYNPISNGGNQTNQWRTLTNDEWSYVLFNRSTTSGIRYAKATVNNVNGVILLPDDWSSSTYSLSSTNSSGASFNSNTLNASQWSTLEQAGAVFLPAAGYRYWTEANDVGSEGFYWSASYTSSDEAYNVIFHDSGLSMDDQNRYRGLSVRLARVAE